MPCFRPLEGWRSRERNPKSGKRSIVFNMQQAHVDMPVTLPCGQCIGCRLERSRQWAIRCVHEATLHDHSSFLTLTYRPENLPPGGTLVKKDFQDFMKKLRKAVGQKIRYFHCGEYGEQFGRPHYHAAIFGWDPSDKKPWKKSGDHQLYTSEFLDERWGLGRCVVGALSFDSAAYVARYITKKITGENAEAHYQGRLPEYTTMSRRPGIAHGWFEKWKSDTYPSDTVIMRGKEFHPPKYYDRQFELDSPEDFCKMKQKRKAAILEPWHPENSSSRLRVKEEVQRLNLKAMKRSYENE